MFRSLWRAGGFERQAVELDGPAHQPERCAPIRRLQLL